ncbi:MAG: GTPase Era [Pseudomonadota bacterium]
MASVMNTRCGYVALLGVPNAGKSTLVNALVGTKVSIVSRKVQTTRFVIRGVMSQDQTQIIFVDTPGIFEPKRRLDRAMVKSAWGGAKDADYAALLIDVQRGFDAENKTIAEQLKKKEFPSLLILTKIDTIPRDQLLALAEEGQKLLEPQAVFMVSATKNDGLKDFLQFIAKRMPEGPWLYPDDQPSDLPMRMLAAEITREKLFDRLHDELPYSLTVATEAWEQRKDGSVKIDQTIFVERDGQKKIVLGKGGAMIKAVGAASRIEISKLIEAKVHLFLHVKTRENWADDPSHYRDLGLEFPS